MDKRSELSSLLLHNEKALKELLPVAVISEIPPITSPQEERKQERNLRMGWAAAGFVFATILAGSR
jgi:hypothetical protein